MHTRLFSLFSLASSSISYEWQTCLRYLFVSRCNFVRGIQSNTFLFIFEPTNIVPSLRKTCWLKWRINDLGCWSSLNFSFWTSQLLGCFWLASRNLFLTPFCPSRDRLAIWRFNDLGLLVFIELLFWTPQLLGCFWLALNNLFLTQSRPQRQVG